jgi:hypothetical protein
MNGGNKLTNLNIAVCRKGVQEKEDISMGITRVQTTPNTVIYFLDFPPR